MNIIEGIDVSYDQGNINWSQVKQGNKHFAEIKATEGIGGKDPNFERNWLAARVQQVHRIAYHFFYDFLDPVRQVNKFHEYVRENGKFIEGDACMVDVEEVSIEHPTSTVTYLETFVQRAWNQIDKPVIIYTNPDTWIRILGNPTSDILAKCPLHLADYGHSAPTLKNWPAGLSFWQYSDTGFCPGISTAVDLDRFYGNEKQLEAILGTVPGHE